MVQLAQVYVLNKFSFNCIKWQFEEGTVLPAEYRLSIYKSLYPGAINSLVEFEFVAEVNPNTASEYNDTSVVELNDKRWYYKITDSDGTLLTPSAIYTHKNETEKIVKEILRRKRIAFKFIKRDLVLLKRKTWGTRCSSCWDDTLMRSTNHECTTCKGTGWIGGYFTPMHFDGMLTPAPNFKQVQMFGDWKTSDCLMTVLDYPIIEDKDIIVDDKGNRWIVISVRPIEKLGYLIEQQVQLGLIVYGDPIYDISI
jgi:hypothetical protein